MLLYPLIEGTDASRIGFGAFGVVVLMVTVGLVRRTPGLTWISVGFAMPAVVMHALQSFLGMTWLLPWAALLEAAF